MSNSPDQIATTLIATMMRADPNHHDATIQALSAMVRPNFVIYGGEITTMVFDGCDIEVNHGVGADVYSFRHPDFDVAYLVESGPEETIRHRGLPAFIEWAQKTVMTLRLYGVA